MKNDLVSVIVPVYNVEKYLKVCIESIINQTYQNIEIILVDDGSTDGSSNICDEFAKKDNRIKVYHKKNNGVSSSRNYGIDKSSGKYIMFVDSDDFVEKEYVNKFVKSLTDDINYAQCNFNICVDDKVVEEKIIKEEKIINDLYPVKLSILSLKYGSEFNYSNSRCCSGKIYLSKIIKDNKIKFNEKIYLLEDGLFNLEYLKYCKKGILIEDCLYNYRQVKSSSSHRYNNDQINQYLLVEKEIKKYIDDDIEKEYLYVISYQHLLTFIVRNIRFNNNKKQNISDIKKVCENEYSDTIKNVEYKNLIKSEKIVLRLLRKKMYKVLYYALTLREKIIKK